MAPPIWARVKAAVAAIAGQALIPTSVDRGWIGLVREPFAGAWQRGVSVDSDASLLAFSAVYACVSRIANDISKLPIKILRDDGVQVVDQDGSDLARLLDRPSHYQNRIQFLSSWMTSKLLHGNTYVLKERDNRRRIIGLYILDPRRVTPMVATSGEVYYQVNTDTLNLVDIPKAAVPATEVIHDRMPALWHPLMGVSPIYACGASATQGIRIQSNSAQFFQNMSRPSGLLTAPEHIPDDTALRLKQAFEENFSGSRIGRLAVLGDGLSYEAMTIPANEAQLIEQLKWTVEDVARCFHVPLHMIDSGPNPTYNNVGVLTQAYYSQTLQVHIEAIELALTQGMELQRSWSVELDLETLLRMDTMARYEALSKAVGAGWMSPNEARAKERLPPTEGGGTPYMQQQNWSLGQLSARGTSESPAG